MRFLRICWTLSRFTVFHRFTSHRSQALGVRLKFAFEELGLTFIKIGQILSMRYDLLAPRDCEALQELLDKVRPLPPEEIARIVESEYQKPLSAVFAKFALEPLGSASVSQVHKAELYSGEIVAVKVKRPGVDRTFFADVAILKRLAGIAAALSVTLRHIQIRELVEYFESWLKQDLNFTIEARNMKRIREQYRFGETNFRPDLGKGLFIAPYEELCTENIIVMDFIAGIPMSRKSEILANPDYDAEKSVKTYVNAAIRNWFRNDIETYLFQADPHLSNVLALPGGDAANIDCGLIGELSKKEVEQCKNLVIAVYLKDLERTIRVATEMTGVSREKYAPILKSDLEIYLKKSEKEGFGFWFLEFAKIMIKHRIKFPLFLTTFGRTNLMLDGLTKTYMPDQTTLDIVGGELKREALRQAFSNLANADWLPVLYALSEKFKQGPKAFADFILRYLDHPLDLVRDLAAALKV